MYFQGCKGPIKASSCNNTMDISSQFQFHKGPIKAENGVSLMLDLTMFQFHKGPIKALPNILPKPLMRGFNSIKVRLKRKCERAAGAIYLVSIP